MTQTTEKWDSLLLSRADFWMVWRCHGISWFNFYFFGLEPTVKRTLGWERSLSRLWSLCRKFHSENYLISAVFKVLNNYKAHWKRYLEDARFHGHRSTNAIILSWINIFKQKWVKVTWKLLVAQKYEPVLWRILHHDISLTIVFFFFSEIHLVFKFNLVLIE